MVRRSVTATWRLLSLSKGSLGLAGEEQVTGPSLGVLLVLPFDPARGCREGRANISQQLGGGLVEADHRPPGTAGFGVEVQYILHGRHELPACRGDAPRLLAPRLERVFSGAAALSRETVIPPVPTPPSCRPGLAASSGRGPRGPDCRPGLSGGLQPCRPPSGTG